MSFLGLSRWRVREGKTAVMTRACLEIGEWQTKQLTLQNYLGMKIRNIKTSTNRVIRNCKPRWPFWG
jgi:hypothetical protein